MSELPFAKSVPCLEYAVGQYLQTPAGAAGDLSGLPLVCRSCPARAHPGIDAFGIFFDIDDLSGCLRLQYERDNE